MTSQRLINSTLLTLSALTITTIATTNHHISADATTPETAQSNNLDQQINDMQNQLDSAQTQLKADNQAQSQQLTTQMNQDVDAQAKANAQAETQMEEANSQALQQAQQENSQISQDQQSQINALKQAQNQQIATVTDQNNQAVTQTQQQAQDQINAINQEADQAIANAKQAVEKAQAENNAYSVKPVNYGSLHDPMINYGFNTDQFENKAYGDTLNGEYTTYTPYTTQAKSKVDWSTQPQGIQDIPVNFTPGLIAYNPDADNSETISKDGLTESQTATIRAFMTKWTNDFRNYVYQNEPDVWKYANRNHPSDLQPTEIEITDKTNHIGDAIAQARNQYHLDNDHHSIKANGLPGDKTYSALINQTIGTANQQTLNTINHALMANHDVNVKSILVSIQSNGENLMTAMSRYNTMQAYLTEIYNMMQAMYYGELVQTHGNVNVGGHVVNVLNSTTKYMAISLQKLDAQSDHSKLGQSVKGNPIYAITFDFIGDKVNLKMDNADQEREYNQKFQQIADQNIHNVLGDSIDLNADAVYNSAVQRQQNKNSNTQAIVQAQTKLTQIKDGYEQQIRDIESASQQKIDQLNQQKDAQIAKIKADTQMQINTLSNGLHLTDLNELKQVLNNKLSSLKQQNAEKIAVIKAEYQTKIKALPQTTDQIKQLQDQLNQLKAQKAQAKSQKPVINTGNNDHQIILPTDDQKSDSDQIKSADNQKAGTDKSKPADNQKADKDKTKSVDDQKADKDKAKPSDDQDSAKHSDETSLPETVTENNASRQVVSASTTEPTSATKAIAVPLPEADINNSNQVSASTAILTVNADKQNASQAKSLPQTGNSIQHNLAVFGLILMSVLTLDLVKLKKRV